MTPNSSVKFLDAYGDLHRAGGGGGGGKGGSSYV